MKIDRWCIWGVLIDCAHMVVVNLLFESLVKLFNWIVYRRRSMSPSNI